MIQGAVCDGDPAGMPSPVSVQHLVGDLDAERVDRQGRAPALNAPAELAQQG